MPDKATLEQVEQEIAQLTPQEQIKLIAHISQRLSEGELPEKSKECWLMDYANRIEMFLKMSDEMTAHAIGETDSAEDMRQIREERTSGL